MAVGTIPPDETTPLLMLHGGSGRKASLAKTAGNIFISIVGAGVLGLPYTFRVSGWAVAAGCVAGAACLTYYCMLLLVGCKDAIAKSNLRARTYGDLGASAFGSPGRFAVDLLILISQIGCCVSYLIFLGQNVSSVFTSSSSSSSSFVFLLTFFQLFLATFRSLSSLAPFSIFADVCNLAAMVLVIKTDFSTSRDIPIHSFTTLPAIPFAIGVSIFCFEGFGMTLTLENSMKQPTRFPRILALDFTAITTLYILFGFVGYWAFGDDTQDIITLNLPKGDVSTVLVKIGLCIGLFFTYPVMMYPVHEIFEGKLVASAWFQSTIAPSPWLGSLILNGARGAMVIGTAILAVSVPGFGIFISLVGGTVCALLAFVLPALFHLQLCGSSASRPSLLADGVLILGGVAFAGYSTYTAVASIFLTPL